MVLSDKRQLEGAVRRGRCGNACLRGDVVGPLTAAPDSAKSLTPAANRRVMIRRLLQNLVVLV
jgi:hypothetical protein